ncbi:hypothetical protein [Azospirillum argentinense]|uniref:PepSY domain-containing protein n=2 Tax=Azospirillum TaxID=191 RepID=A0A2K1G0S0_9PROT|nr:hypothetical protein [Azospirillum argentinense]KAA1058585.1 hypothetical protein FH063_000785 [Azospirillum argentinense]MBK3800447.1 hypothetical protein [Azospirillum argentinense]PNQ98383.1 hypothetical protein C1S70_12975 [Azospirillum argentinense]QCO01809.1 hypothetical protein D3867_06985 [Azospirillum argentinense]
MNAKLSLAVLAATLAAAPAAMAQTYQNNAPQVPYERSSPSGLPTTSPQVESLPNERAEPWNDQTRNRMPDGRMPDRVTSGSAESTVGAGTAGTYGSTGTYAAPGTYGSTGSMNNSMPNSGAMGTTGSATGTMPNTMQGNRQVIMNVDPNTAQRAERGQNRKELMQTSLLNYFSAAGFTSVRDFRKQGENYVAEAQSANGTWSTVLLDAKTGTISEIR